MDTPGFVVGTNAEKKGAPGWIMNFMNSTSLVNWMPPVAPSRALRPAVSARSAGAAEAPPAGR